MYKDYFGFRVDPFHVTPDSSMVFLTPGHREAIGVLEYGLRVRKGFVVITGEVGVGKTTVLRHCLRRLDPAHTAIVYVLQPGLTPHQLLGFIWEELAENDAAAQIAWSVDTGELIRRLLFRLKALHDQGKLIVIVIDEAQNMPAETLESLRLLSNLESDKQKFLQIILAGQPELDEKLGRRELRQLNQRIAVRAWISNLSYAESLAYIRFRLEMAAGHRVEVFTEAALDYIIAKAEGNPRRLNIFCDNALVNGLGHRVRIVDLGIAKEAIEPHLPRGRRRKKVRLPWLPGDILAPLVPTRQTAMAMGAVIAVGLVIGLGADLVPGVTASAEPDWQARNKIAYTDTNFSNDMTPDDSPGVGESPSGLRDPAVAQITLPAPAAKPLAKPEVATYRVESQDTLSQLCLLTYGICGPTVLGALKHANPNVDPDHLVQGEPVRLPVIENLKPVVP